MRMGVAKNGGRRRVEEEMLRSMDEWGHFGAQIMYLGHKCVIW